MSQPLDEQSVLDYIRQTDLLATIFANETTLRSAPIAEGNVNLLFRVSSERDPGKSVLVKQALPYAWRYPDFKMPVDRQRIEHGILEVEARYCPDQVPQVYLYDPEKHVLVIEDLNRHLVMREGLMQQKRYPLVAQHLGLFMARTLFYTSDLYLSSADKKALAPQFINPVLRKVQEDLVFTEPYLDHPNNRWTKLLDPQVAQIHADDELRSEVFMLKEAYMTHAQALIHNDLHTGSIMLNETETKVIDPEFGFFGPIGHDVGSYLSNLVLGYAAQEYHAQDPAERADYRRWLLELIRDTWNIFETEFFTLWENEGNGDWPSPLFRRKYMRQLLQDTAGFGAAEMMRRLIGLAHVHDFWTIPDDATRAAAESLALNVARSWLMQRHTLTSIDELVEMVTAARPTDFM
ncbi:MAG: S-methyl-5-thioribose kinase [Anaerolineae bacterium]|nr:S-methyl-5-thioribose kinase [Anaerolineales bacterium]MCQ3974303.1 S-methyl-5-thioribose kinase [Anaerolineae bacterium]